MNQEENILKTIIEKESWEEIIYYIVSVENIDPWDVDIVKLANGFIRFLRRVKELDFRIPAKVVFITAILLRLKANYLSIFEEKEEEKKMLKEEKPFEDLGIDPNLIKLSYPVKRIPKRQVTLDELIKALRKALAVRERKSRRERMIKARMNAELTFEEDITQRIERIMQEIERMMQESRKNRIRFREIVKEWKREAIIKRFVPLLHLEQNKKIRTEQERLFDEIWITKEV
ncbi:MAG TPA: hypothetical protein ENF38_01405 [Candidatus Aenigmarchaeota archaeon]|nr:hypothetical protein [Candidatus Aenigmarchaeota archaeon]